MKKSFVPSNPGCMFRPLLYRDGEYSVYYDSFKNEYDVYYYDRHIGGTNSQPFKLICDSVITHYKRFLKLNPFFIIQND